MMTDHWLGDHAAEELDAFDAPASSGFSSTPLLLAAARLAHTNDPSILARWLGVAESSVFRWLHRPVTFSAYRADRYAVHLGLHPVEVWPDFFEDS